MSAPVAPSVLVALALGTLSSVGGVAAAASLSPDERARAEEIARAVPWQGVRERAPAAPDAAGRTPSAHPLGVQTLAVELEPRKSGPPDERRARVYQHDHDGRRTRRVRIDLVNGSSLETRRLERPHLPLNAAERAWALERLAADTALVERLRDEQRRRGAVPFVRLDELDVKASVFEPVDPAHRCARERCALLSLFDATRTVFAVEPVVRFADGALETLGER